MRLQALQLHRQLHILHTDTFPTFGLLPVGFIQPLVVGLNLGLQFFQISVQSGRRLHARFACIGLEKTPINCHLLRTQQRQFATHSDKRPLRRFQSLTVTLAKIRNGLLCSAGQLDLATSLPKSRALHVRADANFKFGTDIHTNSA